MKSNRVCADEVSVEPNSPGVEEIADEKAWLLSSKVEKGQQKNVPYDVGSASLFETAYAHPRLSGKRTSAPKELSQNVPHDVDSASLFETAYAHPWFSGKKCTGSTAEQNVPYDVGPASLFETSYAHPWLQGKRTTKAKDQTVPYDVGSASLFETSYSHPWLRISELAAIPWAHYDRFTKWTVALISGIEAGLDQWVGGISPERYHASKSKSESTLSVSSTRTLY